MVPRTRGWGVGLAFATALVSGVAVFVNDYGVDRFEDPTVYTTAKNAVAGVFLVVLLAATRGARSRRRASARGRGPRGWGALCLLGLVGGSVPFVLFFEGLARASSPQAAFIHKSLIVWVAILAVPFLGERLGLFHVLAVALLIGGQAALAGDVGAIGFGAGELLILVATLLWAVEFVLAKRLLRDFGSLAVGSSRMGVGLVVLLTWLAVTGRADDLAALASHQWGWAFLTGGILSAFVATWYAALARAQAVDVTAMLVFGAVVTAAVSAAVGGAALPSADVVGLVLITVGVAAAGVGALRRPALQGSRP